MSILAILVQLSVALRARDWQGAVATFVQFLEALVNAPSPGLAAPVEAAYAAKPAPHFKDKDADKLAQLIDEFVAANGGVPPTDATRALGGKFDWMGLLGKLLPAILSFFA